MDLPKKLLIVKELTFILPQDFNGTLTDALQEYINYCKENFNCSKIVDPDNKFNTTETVLMNQKDIRSCVLYGIVEIDPVSGEYRVIESSNDAITCA